MDQNIFYNYDRVISYNAFLNFLIGERGVGKTFGASEFVTRQFIKKGHEFVYMKRYKTDLEKGKKKFFKSLIDEGKFENHKLEVKGNNFLIDEKIGGYSMTLSTAHQIKSTNFPKVKYIIFDEFLIEAKGSEFTIDNITCGYGMTLTTAQNLKSTNFPRVKTIIFDEFLIEDGQSHYLKNEVNIFLGLIESIARMRDVKIFCIGNATNDINPYFLFFDLTLPYNNDIKLYKNGLILLQYMDNKPYREAKKKTKFGQLVEGTDYEDYAINNKFSNDNKDFIEHKTGNSKFSFSFIFKGQKFGIWIDYNIGKMYVSNDSIDNGLCFATTTEDHKPNTMLFSIAKKYNCWNNFIQNYKLGNVYFENMKIKNISKEVLKNIILRS